MIGMRKNGEAALRKRFLEARKDRDLAACIDPGDLARYVSSLLSGLGVQAANGATKAELKGVVELALQLMTVGAGGLR